jgi:hypothetical protein
MRIITDPESWTGLRSPRAIADDLAPRAEPHQPEGTRTSGGIAAFLRGMLRLFGRR